MVEHHHIARPQGRAEHLAEVGSKYLALVKSLVQRLNQRTGWALPLEGKKRLYIEAE